MSQLQLNGTLVYPAGIWGGAGPAAGVSVEIIENHQLPSSQTTIWSGTTDNSGRFSGQSSEWRRTIRVAGRDELDPTDVLALTCHITDDTGPSRREKTVPFVWLGDQLPSPPIVLTWDPPTARKGRVNGADCWSFSDLARRARLGARTPLTLEFYLYGPDAGQSASRLRSIVEGTAAFAESTLEASTTSIAQRLSPNSGALNLTLVSLQGAQTFRKSQMQPVGMKVGNAGAATQRGGQPTVTTAVTIAELMLAVVGPALRGWVPGQAVIYTISAAVVLEGMLSTIEVTTAVGAVLGGTVAVVGNLPAILLQLAAILDALGLRSAADFLRDACNDVGQWYAASAWFGSVLECCILVVLLIVASLMGMATFLGQIVSGPEGQTCLRLQTSS